MSVIDHELMNTLQSTLRHCVPAHAAEQLAVRLKGDDTKHNLAWALVTLGDQRGFNSLADAFSNDETLFEAAITFGAPQMERLLAQVISRGSSCAETVMYTELVKLISLRRVPTSRRWTLE